MVARGPRTGRHGFTVLETVVGLAVTTIVMTVAMDGARLPALAATKSLDRLQATRAAATALERLDRASVTVGEHAFDPRLPGAHGTLLVRQVSPLLFEATSTVRRADGAKVSTTTRLVREGGR